MKDYVKPEVEKVCEMKAEQVFAAHSWNNGQGNRPDSGNGNGGSNYYDGQGNSNKWR